MPTPVMMPTPVLMQTPMPIPVLMPKLVPMQIPTPVPMPPPVQERPKKAALASSCLRFAQCRVGGTPTARLMPPSVR